MTIQKSKLSRAYCSTCTNETEHLTIAERHNEISEVVDNYASVEWTTIFRMKECCGCKTAHLQRIFHCSEWDRSEYEEERFPPAVSRRPPKWHRDLSLELAALFQEVYTALHANSRRLAAMGARALLDIFMTDQVGDIGSFERKLDALEQQGLVSKRDKSALEAALDTGNAAAHRGHCPSPDEVNYVMDIVENLYQGHLLTNAAAALRKTTPPRKKSAAKSSKSA